MDSVPETRFRFEPNVSTTSPQKLPRRSPRRQYVLPLRRRRAVWAVATVEENQRRIAKLQVRFHDWYSKSFYSSCTLWPWCSRCRQNWLRENTCFHYPSECFTNYDRVRDVFYLILKLEWLWWNFSVYTWLFVFFLVNQYFANLVLLIEWKSSILWF